MVKRWQHRNRPRLSGLGSFFFGVACIALLWFVSSTGRLQAQSSGDEALPEPTLISVFPPGGQQGSRIELEIRGEALDGAYSVVFGSVGLEAQVGEVEKLEAREPATPSPKKKSYPLFRVTAHLTVDSSVPAGTHRFRLVSHRGVSNALHFRVDEDTVTSEIETPHPSARQAQEIDLPVIVNGRIGEHGELDAYRFDAVAGQELTFVITQAAHFEPRLALYRPTGSWLDPDRPTRLLFREQVSSDLIPVRHRFSYRVAESGLYLLEVASLLGKGGPDCGYQLRVLTAGPAPQATSEPTWTERHFTRKIDADWTDRLRSRTVLQEQPHSQGRETATGAGSLAVSPDATPSATDRTPQGLARLLEREPNELRGQALPASIGELIDGTIGAPGDRDTYTFEGEAGTQLILELATPRVGPPHFNPRVELYEDQGGSVLANVHKYGTIYNGGGIPSSFLKTVEPKMAYTLERSGRFFVEVRDVTSRYGGPDYEYRLLVRTPIPHVGAFDVDPVERINLVPGIARKLSIVTHQEEGFAGEVLFACSNLPPGVQIFPGADVEKRSSAPVSKQEESFLPGIQKTTLVLLAEPDAPVTRMPEWIRITARPVVGGRVGADLPVLEVPLMVVAPADPESNSGEGDSQSSS